MDINDEVQDRDVRATSGFALLDRVYIGTQKLPLALPVLMFSLYAMVWGAGTIRAIRFLSTGETTTPDAWLYMQQLLIFPGVIAAGVAILYIAAKLLGIEPWEIGLGRDRRVKKGKAARTFRAIGLFCLACSCSLIPMVIPVAASLLLKNEVTSPVYPGIDNFSWAETLLSGIVGPAEEVLVLAALVVTLRGYKAPWWVVYAVGVTLRTVFHIYYLSDFSAGSAIMFTYFPLWAAATIWLYRKTGRFWPSFAAHLIFNVSHGLIWGGGAITIVGFILHITSVLAAICGLFLLSRAGCNFLLEKSPDADQ